MEWFDYGVFTSGSITGVIGRVFFPGDSNAVLKSLALVAVGFLLALILAVIGSTFPAMFPTHVRYGAFAIGYNVSTSLFGGTCGVVVEWLINTTGDKNWAAYYLMVAAAVAVVPIWRLPETARVPIAEIDAEDEEAMQAA